MAAFYEFSGARDPEVSGRLEQAIARDRGAGVKSLRRDHHPEEDTCWLHGDVWCLSCREITAGPKGEASNRNAPVFGEYLPYCLRGSMAALGPLADLNGRATGNRTDDVEA